MAGRGQGVAARLGKMRKTLYNTGRVFHLRPTSGRDDGGGGHYVLKQEGACVSVCVDMRNRERASDCVCSF